MQDLNIKITADGKEASNQINKLGQSFASLEKNARKIEFPTSKTNDFAGAIKQSDKALSEGANSTRKFAQSLKELGREQESNAKFIGSSSLNWVSWNQGVFSAIQNLKDFSAVAKSAFGYLREGADLAEAETNFRAYAASIGKSSDDLMSKIREATRNQVSDVELMKSATKALRVAGIKDIDQLAKLYEIADTKGDLLGLSLQDTFNQIIGAITSGNGRALIQLGLLPESFSRASDSVNLLNNRAALLKEVIKESETDFKALANIGETASDKFNQIEAAVSNLTREFKIQLADAAIPLIDFVKNEGIPIARSVMDYLNDSIKAVGGVTRNFKYFNDAVKILAASFGVLSLASIVSSIGSMAEAIKKATEAQKLFNLAALKSPYLIIGSLAAGTVGYDLWLLKGTWEAQGTLDKNIEELEKSDSKLNKLYAKLFREDQKGNYYAGWSQEDRNNQIKNLINKKYDLKSGKTQSWATASEIKAIDEDLAKLDKVNELLRQIAEERAKVKKDLSEKAEKQPYVLPETIVEADKVVDKIDDIKRKTQDLKDAFKQAFESIKNPEKVAETAIDNFAKTVTAINGPFGIMSNAALEAFANIEAAAAKVNLKDLTSQINRLTSSEKTLIDYSVKLSSGDYLSVLNLAKATASSGYNTKIIKEDISDDIEKTGENMYQEFSEATANAITDGLLNADFSGFRQNLGSILKSTVSNYLSSTINSVLSGSNAGVLQNATNSIFKQVYTKNSKGGSSLNFGNLLTNVGIGLGVSWLTGEGGLFGKRKIKGGENIDKSNSLNEQVDSAKAIRDELLTAVGITEATRQALENAIFSYTWTTSHKNHNPFHRTKTYYLHGQEEAQASIDYLEKLQQLSQSEQANRNYQLWDLSRGDTIGSANLSYLDTLSAYEYMATAKNYNSTQLSQTLYKQKTAQQTIRNIQSQLANAEKARNDYYQKLVEQYTTKTYDRRTRSYTTSVNTKAIDRAMAQYDSQGIYSYQIKQLQNQLTQAQNNLATITAEYNKGNSNKYSEAEIAEAKLAAEEAKQALLTAQQSERTTFTSNFLNNSTLAGLYGNNASVISKLLGNDYSKFDTTSSIQQMLPMLEAAGLKDYDWQKRLSEAGTDTQKQIAVYQEQQSILESALKTYESIMKDNKEEALNTRLSVEEQQSAFERWQEAFNQVLAIQQEIADNTNTIAELEKSKYADTLADQLSDVMTVVAEAVRQTNGKETVIYYQNATGKEILAKLKAAIQNGNVKNADDLLTAINETEQLEIWG